MLDAEVRDMFGTVIFEKQVRNLEEGRELLGHIAEDHKLSVYDEHGKLVFHAIRV